jgi:ribosomal subunit interface protein
MAKSGKAAYSERESCAATSRLEASAAGHVMSLQVTGKNIRVGESFQTYVSDKIDDAVGKYIGEYLTAHVRVEKERGRFFTSCSVRVSTGLLLETTGEGTDAYSSADAAFEHLEKRLRRYKRRLKNRHQGVTNERHDGVNDGVEINDFVVELPENGKQTVISTEDSPLVVAETARTLHSLSVSEAVMRLDLTEEPFLVFRNAGSSEVNVVYRRGDGNIGWIDPTSPAPNGRDVDASAGDVPVARLATVRSSGKQATGAKSKRSS